MHHSKQQHVDAQKPRLAQPAHQQQQPAPAQSADDTVNDSVFGLSPDEPARKVGGQRAAAAKTGAAGDQMDLRLSNNSVFGNLCEISDLQLNLSPDLFPGLEAPPEESAAPPDGAQQQPWQQLQVRPHNSTPEEKEGLRGGGFGGAGFRPNRRSC